MEADSLKQCIREEAGENSYPTDATEIYKTLLSKGLYDTEPNGW